MKAKKAIIATTPSEKRVMTINPEKTVSDLNYDDLRALSHTFQNSEVTHYAERLNTVLESQELSKWEIDKLEIVFQKFAVKYLSPLSKALK